MTVPLPMPDLARSDLSSDGALSPLLASELYVAVTPDASFKVGTCEHCVLLEEGRPQRAWDAHGDTDLDFDRDRYFALLAQLGIVLHERRAYICP
jgi:hypothetical protein